MAYLTGVAVLTRNIGSLHFKQTEVCVTLLKINACVMRIPAA